MTLPSQQIKWVLRLIQRGELNEAEMQCKDLLNDHKDIAKIHILLSKILYQLNKPEEAETILLDAITQLPADADCHFALGELLELRRAFNPALDHYQAALASEPTRSDSWYALLRCMLNLVNEQREEHGTSNEDFKRLVDLARKAIKNFPTSLDLFAIAGEIFFTAGIRDAAILSFEKALPHRPVILAAHQRWLAAKKHDKNYTAIVDYNEQNGADVAQDPYCLEYIAYGYELLGQYDKALKLIEKAILIVEEPDELIGIRARLNLRMGQFETAQKDFDEILDDMPPDPPLYLYLAQQNRCRLHKCLGNIEAAAKDEFASFQLPEKQVNLDFEKPIWKGEPLEEKRLLIWSDEGIGDVFKYSLQIMEISEQAHIIFMVQTKMRAFLNAVLPGVEMCEFLERYSGDKSEPETSSGKSEEDFDFHIPLSALYTILRPNIESFAQNSRAFTLPAEIRSKYALPAEPDTKGLTKVGLAWTSINDNPTIERNYCSFSDLLPVLHLPGFVFYSFQYTHKEDEIDALRKEYNVPIYPIPGLDLWDDMLSSTVYVQKMDLFFSPACTSSDLAGAMGVKSLRLDLNNLPYNLGQDITPWYKDQKNIQIPWGKTILDYLPDIQDWLIKHQDTRSD